MKPGVTVVSHFQYRDAPEEFSNTFHFTGSAPTDSAGWIALAAAFVTKFRALVTSDVTIDRVYCYTDTANDSVFTYALADHGGTIQGNLGATGGVLMPGDAAYWIRWATGRISSKGKAIYLRKYLHPAYALSTDHDKVNDVARTNLATAGAAIAAASGAWPGMAGPTYDLPASPAVLVSQWITTRTLKRRGKRP